MMQYKFIEFNKNIYSFAFDSKNHGRTIISKQIPYILSLDEKILIKLWKRNLNKIIKPNKFLIDMVGWYPLYLLKKLRK
jgi:hypothetical protein